MGRRSEVLKNLLFEEITEQIGRKWTGRYYPEDSSSN